MSGVGALCCKGGPAYVACVWVVGESADRRGSRGVQDIFQRSNGRPVLYLDVLWDALLFEEDTGTKLRRHVLDVRHAHALVQSRAWVVSRLLAGARSSFTSVSIQVGLRKPGDRHPATRRHLAENLIPASVVHVCGW
jgi:hypothetical protein